VWPTTSDIATSQKARATSRPYSLLLSDVLCRNEAGAVWVPEDDSALQLRLCIVAPTAAGGHRGFSATTATLRQYFTWKSLPEGCRAFCSSCLHCFPTAVGDRTPRPLGEAFHAESPNQVLHMDYIFMGKAEAGQSYLSMLKDFSSYARLVPCKAADAESTIDALLEWFETFGVVPVWVSDRGSHFKNSVVQGVNSALKAQHHFATAYSPWANGTVERLGREVLRATRAILSELKLRPDQWPFVHRMVQSALNNSPSQRLGGFAPVRP
jgi:Integrase core domain/Integrase zinc binding domain